MKSVLVITNSDHADQGAGGRTRIVSEIKILSRLPIRVSLLCIVPLKKFIRLKKILATGNRLSADAGVPAYYIPSIPTSHSVYLARVSQLINGLFIVLFSKIKKINMIHAHGTLIAYSALLSKKLGNKVQVITDVHGSVPDEYEYASTNFNNKWMSWLEEVEKKVIRDSDNIIFVSKSMEKFYFKKFGWQASNYSIVACAANPINQIPFELRVAKRKELKINDKIVFVYLGSFRKYQMVNETLLVFKEIRQKVDNAFLLILTSHRAEFSSALQEMDVSKSDYTIMSAKQSEVSSILCAADLGFLLRDDSVVNRVASPTKYAEYLMSGVPVILSERIGDYSNFSLEHSTGYVLKDFHASDELIQFVKMVNEKREQYYNHCHQNAIELLSWNFAGQALTDLYS